MTELFLTRIIRFSDFNALERFTLHFLNRLDKLDSAEHRAIPKLIYDYLQKLSPLDYSAEEWANITEAKVIIYRTWVSDTVPMQTA
jgi:hypothetical protein